MVQRSKSNINYGVSKSKEILIHLGNGGDILETYQTPI